MRKYKGKEREEKGKNKRKSGKFPGDLALVIYPHCPVGGDEIIPADWSCTVAPGVPAKRLVTESANNGDSFFLPFLVFFFCESFTNFFSGILLEGIFGVLGSLTVFLLKKKNLNLSVSRGATFGECLTNPELQQYSRF